MDLNWGSGQTDTTYPDGIGITHKCRFYTTSRDTTLDDYHREALRIEVDFSLTSERVVRVVEQLITLRGKPEPLRTDHGPEFTSAIFAAWCEHHAIEQEFIQLAKPTQSTFAKRSDSSYRAEVLDAYLFDSLNAVREATETWLEDYNTVRPHESLGDTPPIGFVPRRGHAAVST